MKHIFSSVVFLFLISTAYSQVFQPYDFDKFTPLQSSGTLPSVVGMTGSDFITTSKNNIDVITNRKDKKASDNFVEQSSYSIKDIFGSGRVLYNDPVSNYVEKVRKLVCQSDKQLEENTKVFVIKSSIVNAFATNQGYIFITTGLLSQLEDEGQLAFILCHELIHYKNKHAFKAYVENSKIDRSNRVLTSSDLDKKYLAKANYSKENESEADTDGFDLFSKTKYAFTSIQSLFDVLKYSQYPFEEEEVDIKTLFETQHLILPQNYVQEQPEEVPEAEVDDEEDKFSTHPSLKSRTVQMAQRVGVFEFDDKVVRSTYLVGKDEFELIRKLSRFDLCHTNLINRQYDKAIYNAYCLLKYDADNVYLKKVILKGLYGLAKYHNNYDLYKVLVDYKLVPGESQKLNYLFGKLENNELNVLALKYAWKLKNSLPSEDAEVNLIVDDLFTDMVVKHYPERESFFTAPARQKADTLQTVKEESSKVSKLKSKKKKEEEKYFLLYAFVDELKDQNFVDTYDRIVNKVNKGGAEETTYTFRTKKRRKKSTATPTKYYNEKYDGFAMDADTVLVLNPLYLQINNRKKNPVLLKAGEESQQKANKMITEVANDINLKVTVLDKNEPMETATYNDLCVLSDWLDEKIAHDNLNVLPTDHLQVEDIVKKYGTEHLALMGTLHIIDKRKYFPVYIILSYFLMPFVWPFTFSVLFKSYNNTYMFTQVYNLRTGKTEMGIILKENKSDSDAVVKGLINYYLSQIKQDKVTKKNKYVAKRNPLYIHN